MADKGSPKHGSSPKTFPGRDKKHPPEDHDSESQADGTAAEGETTEIEDVEKDLPPNPTMDSAGEVGDPTGRGTLDIDPEVFDRVGGNKQKRPGGGQGKKEDEAA